MEAYILDLLIEMVETPSVNPLFAGRKSGPGGEDEIVRLLEARFRDLGLETWIVEAEEAGRPSVVGRWRGSGNGRSLMLNGHVDTVGVEDYEDPFTSRLDGDRFYGRGSYDMKGGLAACVATIALLARDERALSGDVWISAVADEEASSLGAQAVANRFPTDGVVVAEPTGMQPVIAHKGFVWLKVETTGFACHGSDHERGLDANRRMGDVFSAIDRFELERSELNHELLGPPSLHVGKIAGGSGPSIYSPSCSATIELRTLPEERTAALVRRFRELVLEHWSYPEEQPPRVELLLERPCLETSPDGLLCGALSRSLELCGIRESAPGGVSYWTDAGFFDRYSKEVVLFGPSGGGAHEDLEWVEISSVVKTAQVLLQLALTYCA